MNLRVYRDDFQTTCTRGALYNGQVRLGFTVEDVVRPAGVKIPGQTAIPFGSYVVTTTWSPHFKRDLPLLLNVPGFDGIRIHGGNTAADTEGCIVVGRRRDPSGVGNCAALVQWLTDVLRGSGHTILIDHPAA